MNNKKIMSMFAIMLIVSIPIYSASVMANFIEVTSVQGSDNIEGFLRDVTTDTMTVTVKAGINGDSDVTSNQVRYGGSGSNPLSTYTPGASFDSCTNMGSYVECTFTESSISHFSNPKAIKVYLYDDSQLRVAGDSYDVYIDELAPLIETFDLSPATINFGDVNIDFRVKERLCSNAACINKCSDMDRIEINIGSYSNTINFANGTNNSLVNCVYNDTIDVPLLTIEPTASSQILSTVVGTITTYDIFGHTSSQTASFNIDTTVPQITNLELTSSGNSLTTVTNNAIPVEVSVDVDGDNLNSGSVIGDLSSLNVGSSSYGNMVASCSSTGTDSYTCRWSVDLLLNSSLTPSIRINASDTNGNVGYATLTAATINYDATGPNVNSIKTNYHTLGDYYIGTSNNKIEIELTEAGIGLYNDDIYLDLSSIGAGQVSPDSCNLTSGDLWTCYYSNIIASGEGRKQISVISSSTDDLGNSVTGSLNQNVTVDLTLPTFVYSNITNLGSGATYNLIQTGDSLRIIVNVSEEHQIVNAYADFSSIIDGASTVSPDNGCTNVSNTWSCTWTTTPIDISGEITDYLKFYFTDAANNTLQKDIDISVYGLLNASAPNYWGNSVSCSPGTLDREIMTSTQLRSYCHVSLSPLDSSNDLETLNIDLRSCTADNSSGNSIAYISNAELLNNARGSRSPYIKLTFTQGEAQIDEIKINCPLDIKSRVGQSIAQQDEEEIVAITIKLYNNPLGEISSNIQDKIEDVEDKVNSDLMEVIGMLDEILQWGKLLCRTWSALNTIFTALGFLSVALDGTQKALSWFPAGESSARAAKISTCGASETTRKSAKELYTEGLGGSGFAKVCNFVNCKMAKAVEGDSGWVKWGSALGGGAGWVNDDVNFLGAGNIEDKYGLEMSEYVSVQDSLLLSVLAWCIPGIIYNINKFRQVDCIYGACVLSTRDMGGVPLSLCESQKDYLTCKYVVGEIFQWIPWLNFFNYWTDLIKNAISDPLALIGVIFSASCMPTCSQDGGGARWPWVGCAWIEMFSMLGEATGDIIAMNDANWEIQGDYCNVFDEMYSEYEAQLLADTPSVINLTSSGSGIAAGVNVTNSS